MAHAYRAYRNTLTANKIMALAFFACAILGVLEVTFAALIAARVSIAAAIAPALIGVTVTAVTLDLGRTCWHPRTPTQ